MAREKELSMLQSACQKLRISRGHEIAMMVVDGQGAVLVPTDELHSAEQWAKKKSAAPNSMMSMTKFMERFETIVARPGTTFGSTKGSTKAMEKMVRAMQAGGYDLKEFAVPTEYLKKPPAPQFRKPSEKLGESGKAGPEAAPEPEAEPEPEEHHDKPYMDFRK